MDKYYEILTKMSPEINVLYNTDPIFHSMMFRGIDDDKEYHEILESYIIYKMMDDTNVKAYYEIALGKPFPISDDNDNEPDFSVKPPDLEYVREF